MGWQRVDWVTLTFTLLSQLGRLPPSAGEEGWGSGLEYGGRVLYKPQVKGLDDSLIERMKEMKETMAQDNSKGSRLIEFPPLTRNLKSNEKKTIKIEKRALMMWNSQQINPQRLVLLASLHTIYIRSLGEKNHFSVTKCWVPSARTDLCPLRQAPSTLQHILPSSETKLVSLRNSGCPFLPCHFGEGSRQNGQAGSLQWGLDLRASSGILFSIKSPNTALISTPTITCSQTDRKAKFFTKLQCFVQKLFQMCIFMNTLTSSTANIWLRHKFFLIIYMLTTQI